MFDKCRGRTREPAANPSMSCRKTVCRARRHAKTGPCLPTPPCFLEQLHFEDAVRALSGYHAILKPGGTLHIIVPDLAQRAREYVAKIGDPAATEAFVDWFAFQKRQVTRLSVRILQLTGWFDLGHCFLCDVPLMSKLVRAAGFEILPHDDSPSASWRVNDPGQVNMLVQKPRK